MENRARNNAVTLPPIRDIFREHLSPESSKHGAGSTYSVGPMRAALSNAETRHLPPPPLSNGSASGSDISSRRYGGLFSISNSRMSESAMSQSLGYTLPQADFSTYDPSATQTKALHPSRSSTNHGRDRSRPTPSSESLWTEHRRRDSTDSIWSSHSGSSGASPPPMRTRPPSNPLQFQPLPHSQMSPALPISASGPRSGSQLPPGPLPNEYQSPFGVLIADADSHFSQYDTQGLMRTGSQSSFQINFEDGRNALTSARYECTYCGKRFTRPSSLRIHNNSHTGEKPFECVFSGCGRRFSVQSNMRRHARVHESGAHKCGDSSDDEAAE